MASIRIKQKKFGPVFLDYDDKGRIFYSMDASGDKSPHPPVDTPVDTLLASLGACIIKSMEWAASNEKTALNAFSVRVAGVKAGTLPNRIETLEIQVSNSFAEEQALAETIAKKAKSICTVSNSLNCEVTLSLQDTLPTGEE